MTKSGKQSKGGERCTFCEKSRHHLDRPLIAGPPGIYICSECVEICNTILKEDERRKPRVAEVSLVFRLLPPPLARKLGLTGKLEDEPRTAATLTLTR